MTAESPPRYTIKKVSDFLLVPADRRAICLREFGVWIEFVMAGLALMEALPVKAPDAFIWIDDDKHTATLSIQAGREKIEIVRGVMRGFEAETDK